MLRRLILVTAAALTLLGPASAGPAADRLVSTLTSMDVEHHWPAGVVVDWRTGEPNGRVVKTPGKHTHCSAFVAAAAERLGVHILRPPEHSPVLLANAQYDWLAGPGAGEGWRSVLDAAAAQAAANAGDLVVAVIRNVDGKPGHIAIVLPGDLDAAILAARGPDVMQGGMTNSSRIDLATGFKGHRRAIREGGLRYYAHAVGKVRG
jgi:hypothetical protein